GNKAASGPTCRQAQMASATSAARTITLRQVFTKQCSPRPVRTLVARKRSFPPGQNLPRIWTWSLNVVIVADAAKRREHLDWNVEYGIGVFAFPLCGEQPLLDRFHLI